MKQKEQVTKKEKRIEMNKKDEMIIDSDSWESCNKLFYERRKHMGSSMTTWAKTLMD